MIIRLARSPSAKSRPVERLRERPTDYVVARVRRFTRLAANYLLHTTFGIDEQTRLQARELAQGAIELALDEAADGDVLWHPGTRPLWTFLDILLARPRDAARADAQVDAAI